MKGLNLKVELGVRHHMGGSKATVVFNNVPVMTWFQTEASIGSEPKFTAMAEFGPEGWKILGRDHTWSAEFVAGRAVPRLEVPQRDLIKVSEKAVRAMFGSALEFQVDRVIDGVSVSQSGVDVLIFMDTSDDGDFNCLLVDKDNKYPEEGLVFTFYSPHSYGWVLWECGDAWADVTSCSWWEIEEIAPFAIRALNEGWINL